jgi:hypothetical protein
VRHPAAQLRPCEPIARDTYHRVLRREPIPLRRLGAARTKRPGCRRFCGRPRVSFLRHPPQRGPRVCAPSRSQGPRATYQCSLSLSLLTQERKRLRLEGRNRHGPWLDSIRGDANKRASATAATRAQSRPAHHRRSPGLGYSGQTIQSPSSARTERDQRASLDRTVLARRVKSKPVHPALLRVDDHELNHAWAAQNPSFSPSGGHPAVCVAREGLRIHLRASPELEPFGNYSRGLRGDGGG